MKENPNFRKVLKVFGEKHAFIFPHLAYNYFSKIFRLLSIKDLLGSKLHHANGTR